MENFDFWWIFNVLVGFHGIGVIVERRERFDLKEGAP